MASVSSVLNPGGRGLKTEVWNDTRPSNLPDIYNYNTSKPGYWTRWTDSLPQTFDLSHNLFTERVTGFLVPPESGNYTIYLHCDDRCELYLSNTSRPEDKVNLVIIRVCRLPIETNEYTLFA